MAKQKSPGKKAAAKAAKGKPKAAPKPGKKAASGKKAAKSASKNAAAGAKSAAGKSAKKPAKPPVKAPASSTKAAPPAASKGPAYVSLGRPKVNVDEPLFMLFKEDYGARQLFAFLRVETVRDLEQYEADDIVRRATLPIQESVERIREKLAEKNRYLAGDEQYLIRYRKQAQALAEKE
ncbi:MAG: hypothetical protein AB7O62_01130 [Pirellulales bacterium]